jgi:putative phosphonate catabolism associated alcohol dehydrogenase
MAVAKTAVFLGVNRPLELIDIPIPPLQPRQFLIRNELTTLCRSDLTTYCGKRIEPTPTILGHEIVGRIEAFGPDTPRYDLRGTELRVGDRVTWAIFASDPTSDMAHRGMPQKAPDRFKYGHEPISEENTLHGGLSEYTILRAHTPILKIDERVPMQVAAIVNCAVATVAGALRIAGEIRGRRVLVSGAGMLGVLACAMAQQFGASHVSAIDVQSDRLAIAKEFGAELTLTVPTKEELLHSVDLSPLHGTDVVLEMSGVPWSMEKTLETLGIGGTAVWIGAIHPTRPVAVDAEKVVRNLLSIRGLHNYNTEDFCKAVDFIESHDTLKAVRDLVHDPFTLDQVNEAFEYAINMNPFRVGVHLGIE